MKASTLIQVVFILTLVAATVAAVNSLPEIQRYLKMRSM